MKNARLLLMPCFLTATLLLSACAPQYGVVSGDRGTRELQRVQVRQRRAIEELRIEQERLRAMLEELGLKAVGITQSDDAPDHVKAIAQRQPLSEAAQAARHHQPMTKHRLPVV